MSDNEWVECPHCNGKKMEFPDCEECEGRGWVDDPDGGTMSCPECNGESCSICDGEGWVAAEQSVHPTSEHSTATFNNSDLNSDDREDSNPLFFTRG